MSRRPAPGRMPARQADQPYDEEGRASKTQRKREAHDLQALGEQLTRLGEDRLLGLPMDERLREAVVELRRTRSHEGRRRQLQFVGKLMRQTDAAPLREAVAQLQLGPAQDSLLLHQTEAWRERLVADDAALTAWAAAHPGVDLQPLRALVRRARAEQAESVGSLPAGQAPRRSRAWRELFQFLKAAAGSEPARAPASVSETFSS